jgi:NAD(P)-dependent dehydrogenase (short-subunit alcohol dehydrogenase family)
MKLAGKVLVVTGAASGIARAVTLEAVRRRAKGRRFRSCSPLKLGDRVTKL